MTKMLFSIALFVIPESIHRESRSNL